MECILIECRKSKLTTANEICAIRNHWEIKVKTRKLPEARQNINEQVTIAYIFMLIARLRKLRELCHIESHKKEKQAKAIQN